MIIGLKSVDQSQSQSQLITRHLLRENRQRLNILLVEDNEINQKLLIRILEKWGHTVVLACNGKEALSVLEERQFNVVLMDVQMPEMDGFEATALIREKEKKTGSHVPIVAMTAHATEGYYEKCINAGMDAYVSKPIQSKKLLEVIDNLSQKYYQGKIEETKEQTAVTVFNKKAALERVEGDRDFLRELIRLFFDNTPAQLENIRKAIHNKDDETIELLSHTLKGAASYLSADSIEKTTSQIEVAAKEKDFQQAFVCYENLENEFEKFKSSPAVKSLFTE
jgi:CheY-like chemotaxis protein